MFIKTLQNAPQRFPFKRISPVCLPELHWCSVRLRLTAKEVCTEVLPSRIISRQIEWVRRSESRSGLLFTAKTMIGKITLSELLFTAKNIQGYVLSESTDNIVSS